MLGESLGLRDCVAVTLALSVIEADTLGDDDSLGELEGDKVAEGVSLEDPDAEALCDADTDDDRD